MQCMSMSIFNFQGDKFAQTENRHNSVCGCGNSHFGVHLQCVRSSLEGPHLWCKCLTLRSITIKLVLVCHCCCHWSVKKARARKSRNAIDMKWKTTINTLHMFLRQRTMCTNTNTVWTATNVGYDADQLKYKSV